ncbi:MAG: glutamate-5-semialdehyde dehydrogenase [Lachnospiraceae bacterium]|nr:glutamate-5-semialdehyde dehydrogenase [Lachnospiraceae bacterium]
MTDFRDMGERAQRARTFAGKLGPEEKNKALLQVASALTGRAEEILKENEKDLAAGRANGMHEGLLDRLQLNGKRIEAMAEGIRQVAALEDPVGEILDTFTRPNGLLIRKVRVPLGVIGIIYESRPNVTADAFSLCFKAGNATILKGGSDAIRSNLAITAIIREALASAGLSPDCVQIIEDTDRAVTTQFMKQKAYVDVLIPRGSASLIRSVVENAQIPVIETGTGNCHIYVDREADIDEALPIIVNAKTQRIGVCNACESLVVHEEIAKAFYPRFREAMEQAHVEIRADKKALPYLPGAKEATEEDYRTEYLDYILSVKTVQSLDEAIAHINRCNTKHSDAILTRDKKSADRFLREVDAACVYVNASTRFTDGFEFGFGAEIGISTQMLHARGPMGLKELTSYKYQIEGTGQIRR